MPAFVSKEPREEETLEASGRQQKLDHVRASHLVCVHAPASVRGYAAYLSYHAPRAPCHAACVSWPTWQSHPAH